MMNMIQTQLGDRVGIKFQQIQKYETGANRISASRMWDIANVLGVPVGFFFEGMGGRTADTGTTQGDISIDKEAGTLVRTYYAIPENQRRRLFDLARLLSEAARSAVSSSIRIRPELRSLEPALSFTYFQGRYFSLGLNLAACRCAINYFRRAGGRISALGEGQSRSKVIVSLYARRSLTLLTITYATIYTVATSHKIMVHTSRFGAILLQFQAMVSVWLKQA
jgi:transcriptional regulator with XRE-family HTH domain